MIDNDILIIIWVFAGVLGLNGVAPFIGYWYLNLLGKSIGRTNPDEAGGVYIVKDSELIRVQAEVSFDHNLINTMIIPWFIIIPPIGIIASIINSTAGTFNYFKYLLTKK